ncbi:hypothetical protein V8E55_005224 [Tylopilus felleus]
MGDLLVECPIHLDAVSINDILVFKCGHGFCEPCLEEHSAHHGRSHLSCPTCRKPIRKKEAISLFLSPAQPSTGTQSTSRPTTEAAHTRLLRELNEAKAAHANCSYQFIELHDEIDTLRRDGAHQKQTTQLLRGRYELLEERLAREADNAARAKEESNRMKEEVTKLQVENLKTSRALEQAMKDVQIQVERVKQFQGFIAQYKHKCNLEKKKRKAMENANRELLSKREDDSLMVVDANAPDMLHQDEPDFGWLDEACDMKGDRLSVPDDEEFEMEKENEDEVQLVDPNPKGKERETLVHVPSARFSSDWNLGPGTLIGSPSGITRKRRQVGGSKIVKVKMPAGAGTRKMVRSPLAFDGLGRVKGAIALGSRQKLNSKN